MSTTELANLVNRLESVALRLEKVADIKSGSTTNMNSQEPLPLSVSAYDQATGKSFEHFIRLSGQIGGEFANQMELVNDAYYELRKILLSAAINQRPKPEAVVALYKPLADIIITIQSVREKNRGSKMINHLSGISESIPAIGWIAVYPTPAPYIKDMTEAGQFYTNRVLVEYKDKDKLHCDWARSWIQFLTDLQGYVKQHHTTGLDWNPKGLPPASDAKAGGPPPPPPPPPMEIYATGAPSQEDPRAALFREINKGEGIATALKHVDINEQTHKNPALRSQGPAPYKALPAGGTKTFQPVAAPKPPKFELEGKKWKIEYQNGNKGLVISETEMNQGIHVFQCNNCLIQVKGKVNSIVLDSCKKTSVVFEDIVSCVEFINCQSMQAQSMGKVPTVSIDKTDGVQLYLSKDSLNCEVVTAKASEINISLPTDDGDFVEHAVPEQFKTVLIGKVLKTTAVDKA